MSASVSPRSAAIPQPRVFFAAQKERKAASQPRDQVTAQSKAAEIPEARPFTEADYPFVCELARARNGLELPLRYYPKTGRIVPGYCCGFIMATDTPYTWLAYCESNPAADKTLRSEATDKMIAALLSDAKALGYSHVFTSSNLTHFTDRLLRHNFEVAAANCVTLIHGLSTQAPELVAEVQAQGSAQNPDTSGRKAG